MIDNWLGVVVVAAGIGVVVLMVWAIVNGRIR